MDGERRGLLRVLYLTIFLTSTGFGTTTFLLPVYATGLGASYIELGLLGAVGNIVYTTLTITSGYLLDRFERGRYYLASSIMGSGIVLLFGAARSVSHLFVLRPLLGVASASFWVTAATLTADISPKDELSQSMGRYNLSWILGFIVGPYLGGLISGAYGFPVLFTVLSALPLLSAAVIFFLLRPRITLRNRGEGTDWNLASLGRVKWAYITLFPFTVVLGIYMAIMPGHMSALGIASALVGLLVTMTNGVRGLGFLSSERFVRWGSTRALALASVMLAVGLTLFSFSSSVEGFVVPLILYGGAAGIVTPVILDIIAKRCDKGALGTAMGVHEGVYGVGMCLGSMAGGAIAEFYAPGTLYLFLAALSLTILPLSVVLARRMGAGDGNRQK
jgi:MFS family permease